MNHRTIARTAAFVESVGERTFDTVMTAACASIHFCLMITTARLANTCQIALYVKKICLVLETLPMKCLVVMLFIGIVSKN